MCRFELQDAARGRPGRVGLAGLGQDGRPRVWDPRVVRIRLFRSAQPGQRLRRVPGLLIGKAEVVRRPIVAGVQPHRLRQRGNGLAEVARCRPR